jgi:adenylate cyclase
MRSYGDSERWWRALLMGDNPALPFRTLRHILGLIPANPRCKFCHAPYEGIGGPLMRLVGKGPSRLTPQLCRQCEAFARNTLGGAEIELTMLFADVRGSTRIAEAMSPMAFSRLINRFFATATDVLVQTRACIDRLVGDQVIGLYIPGFTGRNHRKLGIQAARELLRATGHADAKGPWIPVGAGVHTDRAFVGAVGSESGATDITVLGDAANVTARLASAAGAGEILISAQSLDSRARAERDLESRQLSLKGKRNPVTVQVLKVSPVPEGS